MGVNDIKEDYTKKGVFLRRYNLHAGRFMLRRVSDIASLFYGITVDCSFLLSCL